ncbi:MAG TPA: hypothetical protein VF718_13780 [Allosphingosinicella sp.]
MGDPAWIGTRGGLCLGGLLRLSFQRYLALGPLASAPSSLGALPVAAATDEEGLFLVPMHEGEAAWLGLLREPAGEGVALKGIGGTGAGGRDLVTGAPCPLASATPLPGGRIHLLPGVPMGDGLHAPFAPARTGRRDPVCPTLVFAAWPPGGAEGLVARIELVPPDRYAGRTGEPPPPPADPDSGYQGWLLP